jgi:hypothetical protein
MSNVTKDVKATTSVGGENVTKSDSKFEIAVIPVLDVDRAKEFYSRLGLRLNADFDNGKDFRVVQFTPPSSGCSAIFGTVFENA